MKALVPKRVNEDSAGSNYPSQRISSLNTKLKFENNVVAVEFSVLKQVRKHIIAQK